METDHGEKDASKPIVDEYSDVDGLMAPAVAQMMVDEYDSHCTEKQLYDNLVELNKNYQELFKRYFTK